MHELSIVRTLVTEVRQIVGRFKGALVEEIHLGCGALSGFEPVCLLSAFEQLRGLGEFEVARLVINPIAVAVACDDCGAEFEPAVFAFGCPACGSSHTRIVRGDGLILESVVLAETVEVRSP